MKKERPSSAISFLATILTIIFTMIFVAIISDTNNGFVKIFLFSIVYIIAHIIIGRLVSEAGRALSDEVDLIYNLKEEDRDFELGPFGNWSSNRTLIIGALWPLTLIWIIILLLLLVIGLLYSSIWK